MNCYEAKEKISMYLDGALDSPDSEQLAEHLAGCRSCSMALESLKRVDQIFKMDFTVDPPPEYWHTLPQLIINRLKEQPAQRPSIIGTFFADLQKAFAQPKIRWGVIGATALLALMFSLKNFYAPGTSVTTIPTNREVAENSTQQKQLEGTPDVPPLAENALPAESVGSGSTASAESAQTSDLQSSFDERREGAATVVGNVQRLPVRLQNLTPPTRNKMLYPTTTLNTDSFVQDEEDDSDEPEPEWRVLALTVNGNARRTSPATENAARIDDSQNSFSQTLWIVQQSISLEEKRNIWLSYIKRETDATYRALGIYNLALTLSKIVEESKSREKAEEATKFFRENEELLKAQMGEERFLLKLRIFESLMR